MLFSVAPSAAAAASDEEMIIQVQTNFMKAYSTKDLELMYSLYYHSSDTSTFNPGDQPLLCKGWKEDLEERWRNTFASETNNVTVTFHNPQATKIKDDVAVLTGYEVATYTNPTTKEQTVNHNRVTRVVKKVNGEWLIVHDHVTTFTVK
ncbi:MAG: nuclear transport factor 2 family protein [Deltaproteobacteria bacterium]|nr:nuclear transport factor 2 family protein [Deltaproteobacteria bacterium]